MFGDGQINHGPANGDHYQIAKTKVGRSGLLQQCVEKK